MPPNKKALSRIRLPAIHNNTKLNKLMGCASSQAAEIKAQQQEQNTVTEPTAPSQEGSVATIAGNNYDNAEKNKENLQNDMEMLGVTKYPPAEAFEIPLNDLITPSTDYDSTNPISNDILIKKHPPKRLQRLVEQSQQQQEIGATATTLENLEEKLAKAEIRRQKFLQQRVDTVLSLAQPMTIPSLSSNKINTADVNVDDNNDDNDKDNNDDDDDKNNDGQNINESDNKVNTIVDAVVTTNDELNGENNLTINGINQSSIRNYTAKKIPVVVNKDEKYRSPGDGDESTEILQAT